MKIGTVIGRLEPLCSAAGFEHVAWIQVRVDGEPVTAADPVGAQPGQQVLLALGRAAGHYRMDLGTDALVAAILKD